MKIAFIIKPFTNIRCRECFRKAFFHYKTELVGTDSVVEEHYTTAAASSAETLASKAVRANFNRLILVGGDGLLNQGLNGLMTAGEGTVPPDISLGVIPAGTGNDFAWSLGVPSDIRQAFEVIKKGQTRAVDIGQVNDRFFFNSVSFGPVAGINRTADKLKNCYRLLPEKLSYLLAALKELPSGPASYQVAINGAKFKRSGPVALLAITNGPRYGAMFKINPRAEVDDGKLDLCLFRPLTRLKALAALVRAAKGTHGRMSEVEFERFSGCLTVSSRSFLPYEIDGEVFEPDREYRISVFRRAIPFLVS